MVVVDYPHHIPSLKSRSHQSHLSEYQLIRTRAESLTQSGWGRTVL